MDSQLVAQKQHDFTDYKTQVNPKTDNITLPRRPVHTHENNYKCKPWADHVQIAHDSLKHYSESETKTIFAKQYYIGVYTLYIRSHFDSNSDYQSQQHSSHSSTRYAEQQRKRAEPAIVCWGDVDAIVLLWRWQRQQSASCCGPYYSRRLRDRPLQLYQMPQSFAYCADDAQPSQRLQRG